MDKILIVDSSAQNTELMQQCLDNAGYEILTAESGLNAYAKVQLFKPDLVILDADLPDVSGYDICKKIKASADTQYILVLIVSMFESRDSRVRAVEVGADDFIEKTFDAYILLSKCKSLLRIKHLGDQLKQKYTELEEKNNLLDFQLKTGRQVQHTLIPELDLKFQGARIMSRYMPALDIGGDFYNFIPINEHCFSIVMGDVSGHGISAALLTAMVGTMVRNLAAKYFNPDQLMYYLNSEFCSIFENSAYEMYACVFYAVIDTKRQKIFYTNGGQCLPVYARAATGEVMEMES
ncbi:MAG: fused response regulator/phosphatase, partial [Firmicutes bacterium]|nr:fused response regulator/phosphatase [Bacillota bacterium]